MLNVALRLVALTLLLLQTTAYVITTESPQTDRPVPGGTMYYTIKLGVNDPVLVDIFLLNANQGNTTLVFGNSDLRKSTDLSAGFDIPFCPAGKYAIRLIDTSTRRFLADSPQFDIFAIAQTSPPILSPTTTPTGSPSTDKNNSTNSPAPSTTPSASKPIGAIAGGVAGGILFIVAVVVWLVCRKRRRRRARWTPPSIPIGSTDDHEDKPPVARKKSAATLRSLGVGAVEPFVLTPLAPRPNVGANTASGTADSDHHASTAYGLPRSKLDLYKASSSPSSTSLPYSSSPPATLVQSTTPYGPESELQAIALADQLRLQRERINADIARLEGRTNVSGSNNTTSTAWSGSSSLPASPPTPLQTESGTNLNLAVELATLKEQIRQLETRGQGDAQSSVAGATDMELEPPPMYTRDHGNERHLAGSSAGTSYARKS